MEEVKIVILDVDCVMMNRDNMYAPHFTFKLE